ncbi:MAG: peptidase S58 family protein [Dehalococcoidia bacterium]|nr:peptidase S58 family protein [Dehalococcoidia bacterium]
MPGLLDAITDVPGIRVGHWTDRRAVTGCTVVRCDGGAVGGVDVRGAAPGTRETDLLRPDNTVEEVHAIVLSGGSAFGLDAATGVVRYLAERGIGLEFGAHRIPIVPAAILMDLGIGKPTHPDADAGYRAAARASRGAIAQGSVGAGTGATVAKQAGPNRRLKGGLGTASEVLGTGVIVGAIAAVNAIGTIRDPATGEVVAGPRGNRRGTFIDIDEVLRTGKSWRDLHPEESAPGADVSQQKRPPDDPDRGQNTTIAVIATNARLTKALTNRLATVAHDAFARTTWPAHTRGDGDAIFALATGDIEVDPAGYNALEAMATRALERAILNGVRLAEGLGGTISAAEWRRRPRR